MGLSVTLHKRVSPSPLNDDGDFMAYQTDEMFLYNSTALQNGAWYVSKKREHVIDYPYSSHRIFREKLAVLIGLTAQAIWATPERYNYVPFFKFINFADNEGVIDWVAAKEIAVDFVKYKDAAKKNFSNDVHFLNCYEKWMDGFLKCARKGNVIDFH
jgi:hypothetical protein